MELGTTEIGIGVIAAGYILDKAGGWFLKMSKNGKNNGDNQRLVALQKIVDNTGDIKENVCDTRDDVKIIKEKVKGQHESIHSIKVYAENIDRETAKNTNTLDALHRRLDK